ncbi:hypothetical protein [Latilactobacillus phage TMW 1.591 P1]|nr:hypothetical protein [Latilactobacillus phage TMW 1.591 P1]
MDTAIAEPYTVPTPAYTQKLWE